MSLYYLQKLIYQLNRDEHVRQRYEMDFEELLADYPLDDEEKNALRDPDIGLLYVMGVNGQLLMHYAALRGYEWDEYLQAMRDGVERHGPVRAGLYAMTGT
ncbi:MAG: aromatic ring-opening dioxygenase subunit LigA [Gammaproteobacteria bacterium]|nr:aromatic ring-opening dioxygenase subunit LigA [Gammaproteobacteria bacterium]